jgi:hypothetical protein
VPDIWKPTPPVCSRLTLSFTMHYNASLTNRKTEFISHPRYNVGYLLRLETSTHDLASNGRIRESTTKEDCRRRTPRPAPQNKKFSIWLNLHSTVDVTRNTIFRFTELCNFYHTVHFCVSYDSWNKKNNHFSINRLVFIINSSLLRQTGNKFLKYDVDKVYASRCYVIVNAATFFRTTIFLVL